MKDKEYFLVTASIKETFPNFKKDKVILAGEWCKISLNKKFLEMFNLKTASYHWDKEIKKNIDSNYLKKIYFKIEEDLTDYLNIIHNKNYKKKYWSTIFSPWLITFLVYFFDKYSIIKEIKKKYKINKTKIIQFSNENDLIPQDWRESRLNYQSQEWNHFIFSEIIKKLKKKEKITSVKKKFNNLIFDKKRSFFFKNFLMKLYRFFSHLFKFKNRYFFIETYLGFFNELKLNFHMNKSLSVNQRYTFKKKFKISNFFRKNRLKLKKGDDEFIKILKYIIPKVLPTYYLEGYKSLSDFCLRIPWENNPKIIFTSNCHLGDEVFKTWSAMQSNKNIPIVIGQHGGTFFISKNSIIREIEIQNAKKFLAWGNSREKNKKIVNLFNLKSFSSKFSYNPKGKINLIQTTPRVFAETCISGQRSFAQTKNFVNFQKSFLQKLTKDNLDNLQIRLYYNHAFKFFSQYIDFEKSLWKDNNLHLNIENPNKPISQSINESKLLIHTALESTLILESFFHNIPSIIFFNFEKKILKKEDVNLFMYLKKNGILFDDPKKIAKFINSNSNNFETWWRSRNVQNTVKKFCDKYSSFHPNPIFKISQTLKTIVN